jgi:acetolactate synthase-1/2/3 large subunit
MNGAEWLVRSLKGAGVERVFVRIVDTRNEQAAAYMADTWGRMTRRLGVVAVSAGPGHTNALTGLANAWWDGGPMLLLSGCSATATRGLGHFQELDQVAMAAPACKHARFVGSAATLPHEVHNALSIAVAGRPGPVHLTIPVDVLSAPVAQDAPAPAEQLAEARPKAAGDPGLVKEAAMALARAERPFIVVGSGAFYADAGGALRAFAEATDIPVLSQMWDRGCIEGAWPQYVGVTSGEVNGAYPLLARADVVLVLGARIDYRLGFGRESAWPTGARLIRVDTEPSELCRPMAPDMGIPGDPCSVLVGLLAESGSREPRRHTAWLAEVRAARDAKLAKWEPRGREDVVPVPALRICREIKPFLERDVTFLLDGGNIGRWAHMLLWDRHPSHWQTCGASGVVGWGIGGAVAAKMARPDHPLLLLSGDGAAGFNLGDIETALRFGTPYVAVVAHDGAWGIEAERRPEDQRQGTALGEIRFDRVAEALGGRGVFIEHPAQVGPAVEEGLSLDTVTFVHVPTQLGGIEGLDARWEAGGRREGA